MLIISVRELYYRYHLINISYSSKIKDVKFKLRIALSTFST